ncbi:YwqG family protein [Parvibacter caecicola]|nr:YwqG family protein [Parvibacter caecicola]TJW12237.1 DUF1963 domain-containing protein [Parvibacter caecicola]
MRVWKIKPAPSNKDEVWWDEGSPSEIIGLLRGAKIEDTSIFCWLVEKKPFKKDLHWFKPGAPVISDKAFGALESLIAPYVQFVRVDVGGGAWLVNPIVVLDCLGPLADVSYLFDDPKSRAIKKVNSFDFVPDRVTAPIFKIRGLEIGYCFCTDEFVEKVMAAGLEGFQFVLAWDSECPPGSIRFWGFLEVGDYYVNSGKRGKACLPRENPDAFGQKLVPLEEPPAAPAPSAAGGPAAAEHAAVEPAAPSGAKPGAAPYDGPALDDEIRAVREEALASLPALPAAAGELSGGPCGALGSRVCGSPAMLPGEEWPEGPGGEPLCFLAQLDMADLPPLPGFPEKGLLRLFVGEEPEFGLDPSDMAAQAGFRALWAPDPEGAALRAAPEEAEDGLG